MNTDQKIEIMKAAVQLTVAVLDKTGLAHQVAKPRHGDEAVTPLVDLLFRHLCGLVVAEQAASPGNTDKCGDE